ncbi:hypothetical protein F4680DRAFT_441901 [Xylaria scruposa]|nr:hypothetical protein F4680DRAFT_441901 [Xylaria scruposa]
MTTQRVHAAMEQARAGANGDTDHVQNVDMDRIQAYIHRLPPERQNHLLESMPELRAGGMLDRAIRIVSPPLQQPEDTLSWDLCLYNLSSLVNGSSEAEMWPHSVDGGFSNEDFIPASCSPLMSSYYVLRESKIDQAQKLLRKFIKHFLQQFRRQDPLVFPFIYTSILFYARTHGGIAQYLLAAFYHASETLPWDSVSNPLRLVIALLYRLGPEKMLSFASSIMLGYIDMIHRALGAAILLFRIAYAP